MRAGMGLRMILTLKVCCHRGDVRSLNLYVSTAIIALGEKIKENLKAGAKVSLR